MDDQDVMERIKALDHLLNDVVEIHIDPVDSGYALGVVSGDEKVMTGWCADEDTALLIKALPHMVHVMKQVMEEQGFMGGVPPDIVDECAESMKVVFQEGI